MHRNFLDDRKNGWAPGDAYSHPQYQEYADFPVTYDIGVVVLKQKVTMSRF